MKNSGDVKYELTAKFADCVRALILLGIDAEMLKEGIDIVEDEMV